jgi:hypothetical protein
MMKKGTILIDEGTGETAYERWENYIAPLNAEGYRFPANIKGAKVFANMSFPEGMTFAEIGRMTVLSKFMISRTNMLGYRERDEIKAYTEDELAIFTALSVRRSKQFIKKMVRLHVLQKVRTTAGESYYVNPAYYMSSGQRLTLDLYLLFRLELKDIVPQWVKGEFLAQARAKGVSVDAQPIVEKTL